MAEPEYEARGITVRDVAPAVFIESCARTSRTATASRSPSGATSSRRASTRSSRRRTRTGTSSRKASIARKVYLKPGIGIGALPQVVRRPVPPGLARQVLPEGGGGRHPLRAPAARGDQGPREDGDRRPRDHARVGGQQDADHRRPGRPRRRDE
ncbi:hypothetical protein SO694_0015602 [Aureococcus anophagefferens]|uniref:Uncharacterized protein n=1 Tax=Aureococcus anophagefferens TaxID=44056 RepID=A0ABR1G0N7_AURAN